MKKLIILNILTCTILLWATKLDAQKPHKEFYDNGQVKKEGQYDANGNGTGTWKYYWENGNLKGIGKVVNGKRDGEWKFYSDNGFLQSAALFQKGEEIEPKKGCYFGDCENGYGMNGGSWASSITAGNFKNGKLHGKGYTTGIGIYEGEFVNGKKEGYGKSYDSQISSSSYDGHWKADKKHGKGKSVSVNNYNKETSIYDGDWKEDKKDGYGTLILNDKNGKELEKYVGNWKADKKHGEGKEYKNGKLVYEGNFDSNRKIVTSGCVTGNCQDGYGVFINAEKNRYVGRFKNGKKHGKGFEVDPKGNHIIGHWKDNKESGFVRVYNAVNELMFSGEMKDGNPVNPPVKHNVEKGCTMGDCVNGFGHYIMDDGSAYIGEFKDGIQHGQGMSIWPSGEKYVGQYDNGKLSGYSRYFDKEGKVINEGVWSNNSCDTSKKITLRKGKCVSGDCINGYGVQIIENTNNVDKILNKDYDFKERYEGLWKDGKRHGHGHTEWPGQANFVGELEKGDREGPGIVIIEDGTMYEGDYQNGTRHGQGMMIFKNGVKYTGGWELDEFAGQGTLIYPDGSKYVGGWERNEKHGAAKEYDAKGKIIFDGKYDLGEKVK